MIAGMALSFMVPNSRLSMRTSVPQNFVGQHPITDPDCAIGERAVVATPIGTARTAPR